MFFGDDPRRALLYGFAVYAVGFLTRPLGGIIIGHYADTRGRKPAMRLCLAGAGVAALGMALTPTAAAVGLAAPLLVLFWRALLGFFYGGEAPLGHGYVYEMTTPERRGSAGSMLPTASGLGVVLVNVLVLALVAGFGPDRVVGGYWRIPFLLGAFASFGFAVLRGGLSESSEFESRRDGDAYSWWSARRELAGPMLTVAGVTVGMTAVHHLWSALPAAYGISVLRLNDTAVLTASTAAALTGTIAVPLCGRLGDRVGCRRMLCWAAVALAVTIVPLQYLLQHSGVAGFRIVVVLAAALLAPLTAVAPSVLAGLVPARYRVSAEALPYTTAVTVFGGTVPLLARLTSAAPLVFGGYIVALLLVTVTTLRHLGRRSAVEAEAPATAAVSGARR
ncbi:MFS transporter [Nocardia sp. NPDC051570]|uniref:MFS transporter n=1 Tax=Nocardia sp. NPDC051570 TaxID=3364324 RepID=UPI0037AEEFB2